MKGCSEKPRDSQSQSTMFNVHCGGCWGAGSRLDVEYRRLACSLPLSRWSFILVQQRPGGQTCSGEALACFLRRNVTFSHVFRPFLVATRSSTIELVAGALSYPDFVLALPRLYDTRTDLARRLLWDRVPIELCVHPIGRQPTQGAPVEGGSVEAPHRRATLFELVFCARAASSI